MSWDNDSLTDKAPAARASRAKEGIHSLLLMGRQVFSHSQEIRATSHTTATWENKCHHSECPPFILLPQLYMPYGMEYCFVVSCPGCAHSQILVHPQPTCW